MTVKQLTYILLLGFTGLYSCSLIRINRSLTSADPNRSGMDELRFANSFFEANKQMMLGNLPEAVGLLTQCIQINPRSSTCYYILSNICITQNDFKTALPYAIKATEYHPENFWYQMLLTNLYIKNGDIQKALKKYGELIKLFPEKTNLYFEYVILLTSSGDLNTALKILDEIETKTGITEGIVMEREKIYKTKGQYNKAINEIIKLSEAFPDEPKYLGILGESYVDNKQYDKAIEVYRKLLNMDPDNGLAHLSLADYYRILNEHDKSFEEMKIAFQSPDVPVEMKIKMLLSFLGTNDQEGKQKEQTYSLINLMLETHPDDPRVHTVYADFLIRDKEFRQARDQLRIVVEIEKSKFAIWQQLLLLENDLQEYQPMYEESKEAMDYFPNQPSLYLFAGTAALQLKKYSEAVSILKKGIQMVIDDNKLKAEMYSLIGDTYYKSGQYAESDSAYDHSLLLEPEQKFVLNNYSYYLALRGDSLAKAEKLIRKAVELDPLNSAFLDTYAWILYRLGKYDDAKNIMEKALSAGGNSRPVVVEHYGDILFRLGETEKAIEQWNTALKLGKGSEFLEQKIKEKKLFE